MGNRLSKIYTRTGDDGSTGLGNNTRVLKDGPRIAAVGDVDELNSQLGLLRAEPLPQAVDTALERVQHELFNLGGELATPGMSLIEADAVQRLEDDLDRLNAELPPLKEFILPQGDRATACCHLARAVCRRAERSVWRLHREEPLRPELPRYLNRLSDLLFVTARTLGRATGRNEQSWRR